MLFNPQKLSAFILVKLPISQSALNSTIAEERSQQKVMPLGSQSKSNIFQLETRLVSSNGSSRNHGERGLSGLLLDWATRRRAYGSLMEVVSQLFCALDEAYVSEVEFNQLADNADELAGKIVALSKSLGRTSRIARPSTLDPRPSAPP
jgi:hypothetical protein